MSLFICKRDRDLRMQHSSQKFSYLTVFITNLDHLRYWEVTIPYPNRHRTIKHLELLRTLY